MSAPGLLAAALEVALNRYLALEPEVLAECGSLQGRSIALAVDAPAWTFLIEFHAGGVRVLDAGTLAPDVSVHGSLPTLLRLALSMRRQDGGIPQGLSVDGEVELLRRFNRMLARVGFDPEEFAARFVGDAAAHRLNQGLQNLFGWGRRSVDTLALDTAEYLREESRDLARASDVAEWMESVESLRDGVDRLDARLRRLEAAAEHDA